MEAMFTATPVTVPARCLQGRKPSINTSSQPYTPLPPISPYLSVSSPLIRFQGSFTWMY